MRKLILVLIGLFLVTPVYGETPVVKLETNFGDIVIELFDANAPVTVENFLGYVNSGFYDGLIFHRVIEDFIIQAGAFDANLHYRTPNEPIPSEYDNGLLNERGTIAMALSGWNEEPNRDSATSGFYINLVHNTDLDVNYTVFGRVISDMNVVDRIAHLPTENFGGEPLAYVPCPPGPVIIYKASIPGDLYGDANWDFKDYAVFANQWLDSGDFNLFDVNASDGAVGDWFGYSVAVDANFAIIGAPKDDSQKGAAYVFVYNDVNWVQQAKLTASDGAAGDLFGGSVSISANHAIVSAPGDSSYAGSAYVFECNEGNWTQKAKLTASDHSAGYWFGQSVSISGDCAVVGAHLNDTDGSNTGAAYIFYRHYGGINNWGQDARLTADDATLQDRFGYSVSINGEYIIVGAIGDKPYGDYSGSAYIFRHNGTSWAQQAKLTASDGATQDRFGWSVSIDGSYAIVGAYWNDANGADSGAAYVFAPDDLDPDDWNQITKLTSSDAVAGDYFGCLVAIGAGRALVGAYGNDDNGSSSGSAYIFAPDDLDPDTWNQIAKLTAPDAAAGDYFGCSVAIGIGRGAVIGAYGNDSESGSAYMLNLCPDADLDGDCSVTWNDLAIFADNWLLQ